jgi:hypothetical protein
VVRPTAVPARAAVVLLPAAADQPTADPALAAADQPTADPALAAVAQPTVVPAHAVAVPVPEVAVPAVAEEVFADNKKGWSFDHPFF